MYRRGSAGTPHADPSSKNTRHIRQSISSLVYTRQKSGQILTAIGHFFVIKWEYDIHSLRLGHQIKRAILRFMNINMRNIFQGEGNLCLHITLLSHQGVNTSGFSVITNVMQNKLAHVVSTEIVCIFMAETAIFIRCHVIKAQTNPLSDRQVSVLVL